MPLTAKGREIKSAMSKQYGAKKGTSVFYASKNAGKISGVDSQAMPLQGIMDKLIDRLAGGRPRSTALDAIRARVADAEAREVSAKPDGKKHDVFGNVLSGDQQEAPGMRPQGKDLKELGIMVSGDARRRIGRAWRDVMATRDYGVPGMHKGMHKHGWQQQSQGVTRAGRDPEGGKANTSGPSHYTHPSHAGHTVRTYPGGQWSHETKQGKTNTQVGRGMGHQSLGKHLAGFHKTGDKRLSFKGGFRDALRTMTVRDAIAKMASDAQFNNLKKQPSTTVTYAKGVKPPPGQKRTTVVRT